MRCFCWTMNISVGFWETWHWTSSVELHSGLICSRSLAVCWKQFCESPGVFRVMKLNRNFWPENSIKCTHIFLKYLSNFFEQMLLCIFSNLTYPHWRTAVLMHWWLTLSRGCLCALKRKINKIKKNNAHAVVALLCRSTTDFSNDCASFIWDDQIVDCELSIRSYRGSRKVLRIFLALFCFINYTTVKEIIWCCLYLD